MGDKTDFDFLIGKDWNVHNRLLAKRLAGCTEWTTFDAQLLDVRRILGGLGNIDRFVGVRDGRPFEGISLRLFQPQRREWTIYWADSIRAELKLQVVGGFEAGIGRFSGKVTHDGREVPLRFSWTDITARSARWEQAYFDDRSESWETNWIMEFTACPDPS